MLVFVILFNVLLTFFNCYVILQLWKLRRILSKVTKRLIRLESRIHDVLSQSPEVILKGQQGTYQLRQHYKKQVIQLQGLQKILVLVNLIFRIWQRQRYYPKLWTRT